METTKRLPCNCNSSFQDATYGVGIRTHNRCKQADGERVSMWRCTVCGKVHDKTTVATVAKEDKKA
jgi:hypothetical protein